MKGSAYLADGGLDLAFLASSAEESAKHRPHRQQRIKAQLRRVFVQARCYSFSYSPWVGLCRLHAGRVVIRRFADLLPY